MPNGHDRNWVRLCGAVDGFRVRYGRRPARVRPFPAQPADIRDHPFKPGDYARIVSEVASAANEAPVVAEDELCGGYNYGREGFPGERPTPPAAEGLRAGPRPDEY